MGACYGAQIMRKERMLRIVLTTEYLAGTAVVNPADIIFILTRMAGQ